MRYQYVIITPTLQFSQEKDNFSLFSNLLTIRLFRNE